MVFQLQSFLYAFQKNVLNRAGTLAVQATTQRGLTLGDRAAMLAPAAMLPALAVIQVGIGEARDWLAGDPTTEPHESSLDKALEAISRGGLLGVIDPWINTLSGVRYNRSVAEGGLGPLMGRVADGTKNVFRVLGSGGLSAFDREAASALNSSSSNAAERAAARSLYDLVIEPAANLGLTYAPGLFSVPLTQVIGSGRTREAFIESIAGPPVRQRSSSGSDPYRYTRGGF